MKTLKKLIFSLFPLAISLSCPSMEKISSPTSPIKAATTRAIISQKENIFKELQGDLEQANFVFFDTLVFTNGTLGDALKNAHNNNTHIEGTIGTHWCNNKMETFFNENNINASKVSQNHLKRFGVSEKDPRLGSPGKCSLYEGSANPTNYSYHNFETVIQTKNDKPFFMQHFNDHANILKDQTNSPQKKSSSEKKALEFTPQKENRAISSQENILSESKVNRIKNLIKSKNEQRILYITSMNWNSPTMTQTLIDAQDNGITIRVILNHSALHGKGQEQILQMHKAHVPIYIYYPENNSRNLQHSKVMLRIDGSEYLIINSSANMTPEGDSEYNSDSYYPNNEAMVTEIRTELDTLIASNKCKQYTEELATLVNNEKTKKTTELKKRRLFNENETDIIGKKSKK